MPTITTEPITIGPIAITAESHATGETRARAAIERRVLRLAWEFAALAIRLATVRRDLYACHTDAAQLLEALARLADDDCECIDREGHR